jgi:hypothetical protein
MVGQYALTRAGSVDSNDELRRQTLIQAEQCVSCAGRVDLGADLATLLVPDPLWPQLLDEIAALTAVAYAAGNGTDSKLDRARPIGTE